MKYRKLVAGLLACVVTASGLSVVPARMGSVYADELPVSDENTDTETAAEPETDVETETEDVIEEDEGFDLDEASVEDVIFATEDAVTEEDYSMEIQAYSDDSAVDEEGVKGFVTRLYNVCLDRDPDPMGLEFWSNSLITKDATGCSVAFGFIFSTEFQNKQMTNTEYITQLYKAFLGRTPDPQGLQFWVSQLDSGCSRENIFCGFANSQEFFDICKNYGIFRGVHIEGCDFVQVGRVNIFVDNLYVDILGRDSEAGGLYDWSLKLITHQVTAYDTGKCFVLSSEFIDRHVCSDCFSDILAKAFWNNVDSYGYRKYISDTLFRDYDIMWGYEAAVTQNQFKDLCDYYGIECGAQHTRVGIIYGSNGNCSRCGSTLTYDEYTDSSSVPFTGPDNLVYRGSSTASLKPTVNPLDYTYEVIPLVGNLNDLFYIKTDNPDPWSFSLFDNETIYGDTSDFYTDGHITPITCCFPDVVYENEHTGRVKGGYLACSGYTVMGLSGGMRRLDIDILVDESPYRTPITDGGPLQLMVASSYTFSAPMVNGEPLKTNRRVRIRFNETDVYVNCPKVVDSTDYLIDNYGDPYGTFFENLDSIQAGLGRIAVYPAGLVDDFNPTSYYPAYGVSSIYPEQSINAHSNIYPSTPTGSFLGFATPFILHSESFPDTMGAVAKRLEPSCTVERTGLHWMRNITFNGVTKTYGGQGYGSPNSSIYLSKLPKNFTFDGSSGDMGLNCSIPKLREEYIRLRAESDKDRVALDKMLSLEPVTETPEKGAWISVVLEGYSGRPTVYAYYCSYEFSTYSSGTGSLENAWIDGRYINILNFYQDITFEESMANKPKIVENGRVYNYVEAADCWVWSGYVNKDLSTLPEDYILTREEIAALNIDRNHDKVPEHGFIYDGSAKPGTPF